MMRLNRELLRFQAQNRINQIPPTKSEPLACQVCGKIIRKVRRPWCWKHSPYVIALLASKEFKDDQRRVREKYGYAK